MATPTGNLSAKLSITTDNLFNANTGTGAGHIAYDIAQLDTAEQELKNDIIEYIRLRLGYGIVDVEADKEHFDMGIKQAFIRYRQKSSNAVEESYAFLDLLPETQEYILPREIEDVRQVYRRGIGSTTGTSAAQFEPFSSGFLNTYMLVAGRVGGLASYEMFVSYQKLVMTMFGGYMNFTWNKATRKLTVIRKIPFNGTNIDVNSTESVLLHVYNKKPDAMLLNNSQTFPWIQDYAYAFVMQSIGEAREKFSTINGPQGGTTLNGAALKAQAKELFEDLDNQITSYADGGMPLTWITG